MPLTKIRVTVSESHYGDAIFELNRRGSLLVSLQHEGENFRIEADTPVQEVEPFKSWLANVDSENGRVVEVQ